VLIPSPILLEIEFLLRCDGALAVFAALLGDVSAGFYTVVDLLPSDYERVRELCLRYADADVGFVDAAVLAVVERLDEPKLATLDRRHFALMCSRHVGSLTLLSELA